MPLAASIREHGDHVYITCPVSVYEPEAAELESFAFATDLRSAAPNSKILWLRGQYVEAEQPNLNADQWSAGELAIKALTPVLMPVTVMHDLRSAVGTIADAKLLTPEADNVPRARIDTTLAIWEHRFPQVAAEVRVNAKQSTLMQSMECLSPYYDCSVCGAMMHRTPDWQREWSAHTAEHTLSAANGDRSPARILRNVTFTGTGLIFGTRGARGAMPTAHLEVEELAAMHQEAHAGTKKTQRARRTNTVDIEDSKYESLVAGKSDAESKVTDLTARLATAESKIETLEASNLTLTEERDKSKKDADDAKEAVRVAAMRDERLSTLGTGFRAKLDKLATTAERVKAQAATLADAEWTARLDELEETLGVKRDAKLDAKPEDDGEKNADGTPKEKDALAGLLFDRKDVAAAGLTPAGGTTGTEVVASEALTAPTAERRQSVMGGLIRKPAKVPAKA